jgi:hypothetical protein
MPATLAEQSKEEFFTLAFSVLKHAESASFFCFHAALDAPSGRRPGTSFGACSRRAQSGRALTPHAVPLPPERCPQASHERCLDC